MYHRFKLQPEIHPQVINNLRRRVVWFMTMAASLFLFSGCSDAQQPTAPARTLPEKKILIVYLSRTSNTKVVADMIRENVGGTTVALELETPYPENYRAIVDQVARENDAGYLPPLKTKIENIGQFDLIFLGFPTWGMQLPPPVKSFLKQHDLTGKTVVPFNTNAGYGPGAGFQTVKELCTACVILEGFTTRGGIERDGVLLAIKDTRATQVRDEVRSWLRKLKLLE